MARSVIPFQRSEAYHWVSPEELLILRPSPIPPEYPDETLAEAVERAKKVMYTAYRVVLSTGEETPFEEFNRRYFAELRAFVRWEGGASKKTRLYYPPPAAVSPDGCWLLWWSTGKWRAARFDGSGYADWTPEEDFPHSVIWLRDSQQWLRKVSRFTHEKNVVPEIQLHHREHPDYRRRITAIDLDEGYSGYIAGITSRNTLLLHHLEFTDPNAPKEVREAESQRIRSATSMTFSEVDLRRRHAQPRRFTMPLPIPGFVFQSHLSPTEDRIAVVIEVAPEHRRPNGRFCLWTCDLNGSSGAFIGWTSHSYPLYPKWSPDGKQISFVLGKELWTVPTAPHSG